MLRLHFARMTHPSYRQPIHILDRSKPYFQGTAKTRPPGRGPPLPLGKGIALDLDQGPHFAKGTHPTSCPRVQVEQDPSHLHN